MNKPTLSISNSLIKISTITLCCKLSGSVNLKKILTLDDNQFKYLIDSVLENKTEENIETEINLENNQKSIKYKNIIVYGNPISKKSIKHENKIDVLTSNTENSNNKNNIQ